MKKDRDRIEKLAAKLKSGIETMIPHVKFNGHPDRRVKSTLNFTFPGVEAEAIQLALALKNIFVSTGSACSSESDEPSHILLAIGLKPEIARSSIRMSLGRMNCEEDIAAILQELPAIVADFREKSPFHPYE